MKYLATIFITFILTLILLKQCGQPKQVNQTVITQTKHIIDSLKTITYHDTIEKIKTKYRVITDSIRFYEFDTSWHILRKYVKICDSINEPVSDAELQSVVLRKLVGYCECVDLNSIYQKRRETDSLIILNQDTLINIVETENKKIVKAAAKETKRKKLWTWAAMITTTLFLIK